MRQFLIGLLLFTIQILPQQDTITVNDYIVKFERGVMTAAGSESNPLLEMTFISPSGILVDLDGDSLDELLVIDYTNDPKRLYTIFIFNTTGSFFLVDTIYSGTIEPFITDSEELSSIVIVTGDPDFLPYQNADENYLPIDCWKFEGGELYNVDDEIYDLYISENDALLPIVDDYFNSNINNCDASTRFKSLITTAYINYINAGEHSLASQFLKKYYLCDDIEEFKNKLHDLLLEKEL